jgi:hypothetical protein
MYRLEVKNPITGEVVQTIEEKFLGNFNKNYPHVFSNHTLYDIRAHKTTYYDRFFNLEKIEKKN